MLLQRARYGPSDQIAAFRSAWRRERRPDAMAANPARRFRRHLLSGNGTFPVEIHRADPLEYKVLGSAPAFLSLAPLATTIGASL